MKSKELTSTLAGSLIADSQKGSGFETVGKDDVAIPFIVILQSGSPQVKKGERKIVGAEEGDFFNTVTNEVYKGVLKTICSAYRKAYVEWTPRDSGGGFIAEHISSDILKTTKKGDKGQNILPNDNIIVTTAYHYCILLKENGGLERVVLSFSSTQLKKSRKWNSTMMALLIDIGDQKIRPPMYSHIYEIKTVPESNKLGEWSGWSISSPVMITDEKVYATAKSFHTDVEKGVIQTAKPEQDTKQNETPEKGDDNVL